MESIIGEPVLWFTPVALQRGGRQEKPRPALISCLCAAGPMTLVRDSLHFKENVLKVWASKMTSGSWGISWSPAGRLSIQDASPAP